MSPPHGSMRIIAANRWSRVALGWSHQVEDVMGAPPLTILIAATLSFALACPIIAQGGTKGEKPMPKPPMNMETVRSVSPALERYTTGQLVGEVWMRSDLSPRDRSVATVAALIARNQTLELPYQIDL